MNAPGRGQEPAQHPWAVFGAVIAGYFLVMFAVAPVSVILPSLAHELDARLEAASWVMTAYLLPLTALLLGTGRLADLYGHRRLFTLGLAVTTLATLACGLAPSLPVLLAGRVAQGAGAALMSATSLAIITSAAPPAWRGRAIGIVTMSSALAAMLGTALASLFVTYLSWRWAFISAAPVGAVALVLALRMGPDRPVERQSQPDWAGALLLIGALTALSLSLSHFHDGPETFEAGWPYHSTMHLLTALLLALFVWAERRTPQPLVRLDQLRNGVFVAAVGANCILHMTMLMAVFSTPFLIERGLGLPAAQTGTLLAVVQLSNTAMTLLSGWLHDRTRTPLLRPLAIGAVAAGLLTLGLTSAAASYPTFFAVSLLMGCGSGLFMTSNNTVIMTALPRSYTGFASGMLETTRQLGHTLGVVVATAGLSVIGSVPGEAQQAAFIAGFQRACLLMGAIALAGAVLAAVPPRPARRQPVPAPALADALVQ